MKPAGGKKRAVRCFAALALAAGGVAVCAAQGQLAPLAKAEKQVREGNCPSAVETLTAVVQSQPKNSAEPYGLLGACYIQMRMPDKAIQTLRSGLKQFPQDAVLARSLGELLFQQRAEGAEAGDWLAKAVKGLPKDPESRHYYAQWAFLNSRERVCVEQEQAALKLPGLNDLALFQMNMLLGMCGSRLEDAESAKAAFRTANEINLRLPNYDPVAAYQYVQFLTRFAQDAEVQEVVEQILKRTPNFAMAHLERAKFFDRTRQPERAMDEARLALAGAGSDINSERAAHGILAKSYFQLGRTKEAEQEQQWIEAHPNPETPR